MKKYHVKFSHIIKSPNLNQTNIPIEIIDVDGIYQVEPHRDIFELIHSSFNVVGGVTVTELSVSNTYTMINKEL